MTITRAPRRTRLVVAVAITGLVAASCGGDDDSSSTTAGGDAPATSDAGTSPAATGDGTAPSGSTDTTGAPSGTDGPAGVAGGELTIAPAVTPTQLDPHKQAHAGEEPFIFAFYDRLTQIGADTSVEPMLATEWSTSDDGLTLTMQLRDDVTFADGTPFDADAVVANIDRAQDLEDSTVARQLESVSGVEAAGPTEVVFTLSEPRASLPATLAGAAGAMISPAAIADGRDLGAGPGDAGSGPYLADSVTISEQLVLVPRPDYWDSSVTQLDRLTIVLITDQQTRLSALQTGEVDAAATGADPEDVARAQELAGSGDFQLVSEPTTTLMGLMMRGERPPTESPATRQAIVQSIDTTAIVEGLLGGTCTASTQIYPEGTPGHVADFDPYPYDSGAALSAAGVSGPLEMVVNAGQQPFARVSEVVQAQLSAGGLETQITPLSSVEALTKFGENGTDFWMYQLTGSLDASLTVSDYILGTRFGSESEEVRAAVDAAEAATDPDERAAALEEVTKAVADEAVIVPICFLNTNWIGTNDVAGLDAFTTPYSTFAFDVRRLGSAG